MSSLSIADAHPLPDALSNIADLAPFARVKIIAFDLDGTLISHHDEVLGPRLSRLFATVSNTNVKVTLATGRTLTGVSRTLGKVDALSRIPLVLYNGSVVIRPEEKALIAVREIPRSSVMDVYKIIEATATASVFVYCIDPEATLIGGSAVTESVYFFGDGIAPTSDFNGMQPRPFSSIDLDSSKPVAILIECPNNEAKHGLISRLSTNSGFTVTSSGSKYIELRPIGASKADGLQKLTEKMNILPEHVLAVGDNDNDVELLTWAGLSVCVKNSSPAARAASKFYSNQGAGSAAIEVLELVRRAQRLFKEVNRYDRSLAKRE